MWPFGARDLALARGRKRLRSEPADVRRAGLALAAAWHGTPAELLATARTVATCSELLRTEGDTNWISSRGPTWFRRSLVGYGIARIIGEVFRQPDAFLGFLFAGATMGQLLSVPMILAGAWLIARARPVAVPA